MGLIKCKECGIEMSDHAKFCPHCGIENSIMFCPECDKKLSSKANFCPSCGFSFNPNNNMIHNDERGENYNMALAAFICSFIGFTTFISLILGIIVINSNKGRSNSAKTMGIASVIISSVSMFIYLILLIVFFSNLPY